MRGGPSFSARFITGERITAPAARASLLTPMMSLSGPAK